nr:MAG TPA: hypothetical protein [Caudoviricetes sp.]
MLYDILINFGQYSFSAVLAYIISHNSEKSSPLT